MMNLIIEGGAAWVGTAVDLPAADREWGKDATFYYAVERSRDAYSGDTYPHPTEWQPKAERRRRTLPWSLRRA